MRQAVLITPTVFGTKVISTVLVFPVVILVFWRMTLFESICVGVFPEVAVNVSVCTAPSAAALCEEHQQFQILHMSPKYLAQEIESKE